MAVDVAVAVVVAVDVIGIRVPAAAQSSPALDQTREPLTAVREIYHVTAEAEEDQALVLAIAMSIVEMTSLRGQE